MKQEIHYSDALDETLVSLTVLGDNRAFGELVLRYQKAVAGTVYSVTRNASLAEDIIQDAFVSAWLKLDTLKEAQKFGAWVCRIAKNKAKNLVIKYREHVSFDLIENTVFEQNDHFEDLFFAEKHEKLHAVIDSLSGKLREVINLHYFENAGIDEIARKLNLPPGTVKWRLHEGREKIRKGLGYMDSKHLAKSVLEKIERIKAWQTRDSKDGFETDYHSAMTAIETMPDSEEKYFYMAEAMQKAFWWLPGKDNDEMVEKIRQAAEKGNNKVVLGEIWKREADKYSGDEKTDFILNTLILRMEQAGMTDALGWEWFWLGYEYFKNGDKKAGYAAYNKVLDVLPKHHVYHANAISAARMEKLVETVEEDQKPDLCAAATGEQLVARDGRLYFYLQPGYSKDGRRNDAIISVLYYASRCDNILYDESLKPGESITSYDGNSTLTFVSDSEEIDTACGRFDGCELWKFESPGTKSSVYYKRGIGIVYISTVRTGGQYGKDWCSLKKYTIVGGDGMIPVCEGNKWEYACNFDPDAEALYEITSVKNNEIIFAAHNFGVKRYSPDSWEDMMKQMRYGYCCYQNDQQYLKDISLKLKRARALADTKYKKAHTKVASEVMKRIFEGDSTYTPDGEWKGRWNFFQYYNVRFENGAIKLEEDRNHAFEWKNIGDTGDLSFHLAVNYFMSIIHNAVDCIWNDEWKPGAKLTVKGNSWFNPITEITVEHLDTVEVAAGVFNDCLKVNFDIKSPRNNAGWNNFLKGKKEYYYARGIGLVKGVHYFKDDTVMPVYELVYYEGTGEGYMPVEDGLFRRYKDIGTNKDTVAGAEYTFVMGDDGVLKILESNIGYQKRDVF